jgi:UDP-GlcNAc:undecaprenyl-phosphate GlcNAc-1-phosphate transferase
VIAPAVVFAMAALAAAGLTPAVHRFASWRGAYDQAGSSRKVHGRPVPRLGGVAIYAAFAVTLLAWAALAAAGEGGGAELRRGLVLLGGAAVICALGVYDDLHGANARVKLTIQFLVAAAVYAAGFRIEAVAHPFGEPIALGPLALPFTMLWIAGVVNAMNLIDGLDGLAAGVAALAAVAFFTIGAARGDAATMIAAAALAGAVLGFLPYNLNPASIFMGDSGSMFLGFVLAVLAIQPGRAAADAGAVPLLVPILALGVPVADTLLAIARRALRGVPLFSADRGHIHHRLLDRGLSQRRTVAVLHGATALLGTAAVLVWFGTPSHAVATLGAFGALALPALRSLGFLQLAKTPRLLAARRRNLETQARVRRAGQALRDARTLDDVWLALRLGAKGVGASAIALRPVPAAPPPREPFTHGFDVAEELLVARFGLDPERPGGPGETFLELGWNDGRVEIDRDTEIAVEILCGEVSGALERLGVRTQRRLRLVSGAAEAAVAERSRGASRRASGVTSRAP